MANYYRSGALHQNDINGRPIAEGGEALTNYTFRERGLVVSEDGGVVDDRSGMDFFPPRSDAVSTYLQSNVGRACVAVGSEINWIGEGSSSFSHTETIREEFHADYEGEAVIVEGGEWDRRGLILHASLAALDTTDAGFDEAYVRALQAINVVIPARRMDISHSSRSMIRKNVSRSLHPARLLLRGAILWTCLNMRARAGEPVQPVVMYGDHYDMMKVTNVDELNAFAQLSWLDEPDVVYVAPRTPEEAYLVGVAKALTSTRLPLESAPEYIAKLWPSLNSARVMYSGATITAPYQSTLTASDVWWTMEHMCGLMDCHDLWRDILSGLQSFMFRPRGCGPIAGAHSMVLRLPRSDLRANAIGPLFAGLSVEGMKSEPFDEPNFEAYMYGAAVKGIIWNACVFEQLLKLTQANHVSLTCGEVGLSRLGGAVDPSRGRAWMDEALQLSGTAGWKLDGELIRSTSLLRHARTPYNCLRASRVTWWTPAFVHLRPSFRSRMAEHMVPAQPRKILQWGRWYSYHALETTSSSQVVCALNWLGADVRYNIMLDTGEYRILHVPAFNWTRFSLRLPVGSRHGGSIAAMNFKFPRDVVQRQRLVAKLDSCMVQVSHYYRNDVTAYGDDDLFGVGPDWDIVKVPGGSDINPPPSQGVNESIGSSIDNAGGPTQQQEIEDDVLAAMGRISKFDVPMFRDWKKYMNASGSRQALAEATLVMGPDLSQLINRFGNMDLREKLQAVEPAERAEAAAAVAQMATVLLTYPSGSAKVSYLEKLRDTALSEATGASRAVTIAGARRPTKAKDTTDPLAEAEISEVIAEAAGTSVVPAPDDPVAKPVALQDFGRGTSPTLSAQLTKLSAESASPTLPSAESLAFDPHRASSSSQ
uniref:Coat protein n=1 Tax=Conidiobolus heterosporus totivirus 2 TaxID=2980978 RepID=A0A977WK72_9VIRU|nr:coat protein [Conidiobolus heterosporus totivirus 2]